MKHERNRVQSGGQNSICETISQTLNACWNSLSFARERTGSNSFYHISLICQFIEILLYVESGAPEEKPSLIKL